MSASTGYRKHVRQWAVETVVTQPGAEAKAFDDVIVDAQKLELYVMGNLNTNGQDAEKDSDE